MKKFEVLKAVVALQACCMIALAVFVAVRLLPDGSNAPESGAEPGSPPGASAESPGTADSARAPVASVGGRTITAGELQEELLREYGAEVLRRMMVREAVKREAEAYGISVSPRELEEELAVMMEGYGDEDSFYASMREQLGMEPDEVRDDAALRLLLEKIAIRPYPVTDGEVDAYIAEHGLLEPETRLTLAWIVTVERGEAEAVLERLADGESFEGQARTYSVDEFTSQAGGSLGTVEADDPYIDPAALALAETMEVGEIAGPVETASGWAVVRLDARETAVADVRSLREQVRKQLGLAAAPPLREVEETLLRKYGAEIVDDRLSAGP